MKKDISRRDFIKKSAFGVAGIAAMGVLGGCSSTSAATAPPATDTPIATATPAPVAEPTVSAVPSFLVAPDPIPDSDISETITADVVIVGCGVAGLCAARAAAEQGVSVAVIEKGTSYQYPPGSMVSMRVPYSWKTV